MVFNSLYFEKMQQGKNKSREKFLLEKNEYLKENNLTVKKENYDNLNRLEEYISLYPKDSQNFFTATEHKYDYFYRLYRHLQQNYFAKKFNVKLIDPKTKIKNSKNKYFIFRPWGNEPNAPYYNHSVFLEKNDNCVKLYDTLLYPIIITNDKGKKKAKRDENKKLIENVKLKQYVIDAVKKLFSKTNDNVAVEECEFLQNTKTNRKITKSQKSSAGCFEMCLYTYFLFKHRDSRINKIQSGNLKQTQYIIEKTDELLWNFAKKIKLLVKGKGVKDKDIFDTAIKEIEKIR